MCGTIDLLNLVEVKSPARELGHLPCATRRRAANPAAVPRSSLTICCRLMLAWAGWPTPRLEKSRRSYRNPNKVASSVSRLSNSIGLRGEDKGLAGINEIWIPDPVSVGAVY